VVYQTGTWSPAKKLSEYGGGDYTVKVKAKTAGSGAAGAMKIFEWKYGTSPNSVK
jgi:hypothetical protein